ncbi:T9SS type A sorting domain-containing protein [Flavobacteriaceae bacterium TK19130]|nr:T9SS type A sorting domain-containing protein [Thermobacterium salinum]
MKKGFLLFLCFILAFVGYGQQEFLIVTSDNVLKSIDSDFNSTTLFTIPTDGIVLDIALSPSGALYAVIDSDSSANATLNEIDLETETLTELVTLPPPLFGLNTYSGLVCDENDVLYTAKRTTGELLTYDISEGILTQVEDEGFATFGDYSFLKGQLVYPNNFVKAYDGENIISIGCSPFNVFSFINLFSSCNENILYGITDTGIVYEYNFEMNEVTEVANLSDQGIIYGAASFTEHLAAACPIETINNGVDENCELLSLPYQEVSEIKLFPNPVSETLFLSGIQKNLISQITVRDMLGRIVVVKDRISSEIDATVLNNGLYVLSLYDENQTELFSQKFVKY